MNSMVITNVGNRSVYLLNDNNVSFYINMPDSAVKNVSIAINLLDRTDLINISVNGGEKVKDKLFNIYNQFNYNDIVFVTPVIDSNICEQLKLSNNEKIFIYTDKYISYLINQVYSLLASSNIGVNKVIKLNNNSVYKRFNDWFINKYNGRVELVDYNKVADPNNFNNGINNANESEFNAGKSIANQVLDATNDIETIDRDSVLPEANVREPGFVSYVLLGVIVVVISLVILYKLL